MTTRHFFLIPILFFSVLVGAQTGGRISGVIADTKRATVEGATINLLRPKDSGLVKLGVSSRSGQFELERIAPGHYLLSATAIGFDRMIVAIDISSGTSLQTDTIFLQPSTTSLGTVTVRSQKPFIEMKAGVTIVNVESSVSNVGANALEVLEKSPGVAVDRDGNISLKGKQNVLVWVDGKQTYLPPADLAAMLGSLPASQLEQIEIMTNPTAKYDAAGSTGIIHIKTKKLRTQGFNGNATAGYGQGRYYKTNNSLLLNYRNQAVNLFLTYSYAANRGFTDLYALRTYYANDDKTVRSYYEQPGYLFGHVKSHTVKTGMDYRLSKKTTLGVTLTGIFSHRTNGGNSPAYWINAAGQKDSALLTTSDNSSNWRNLGTNINLKHSFSKTQELSADLDYLGYKIENNQSFQNTLSSSGLTDGLKGFLPSQVNIFSGKADYTQTFGSGLKLETGWKSARVNTDNIADYYALTGGAYTQDLGKTNHFIYHETIHALYLNLNKTKGKFTIQGGLRFENTAYDATQKGNAARKDSSFSKAYAGLFPSAMFTVQADSNHSFSLSAGRRIDRPAFQKLNPFVFVINKYTYQQGNPFFKPQYTWNFEFTHNFRDLLLTSLSYSYTKDYFSQIFYANANNIIIYSEGNLGRMQNFGISISTQLQPLKIWSLNLSASLNYKKIEGYVWSPLTASLTQGNLNMNNQFRLKKGWTFELSGFYNTSEQELQEITDPTGQLSVGVSKQLFGNKASVKLNVRDVFYTQAMKGFTIFEHATEYFKLTRDTRVVNLALTWRFGKTFKDNRRPGVKETEESKRMGNN
ncbi:MAG: TonB-dependent receptor [Chitinophagaceae bacterium]|nr:TonB-dependent receptor [Chitinophagaceae bacterium]